MSGQRYVERRQSEMAAEDLAALRQSVGQWMETIECQPLLLIGNWTKGTGMVIVPIYDAHATTASILHILEEAEAFVGSTIA